MLNKKILMAICYIILGVFVVQLLLKTDFVQLIYYIKQVSLEIVVILVILQVITQILIGLQWQRISNVIVGKNNFFKIFYILSTGTVIEAITPGAKIGGEVTRLFYLKKELNASTNDATSIIIVQKCISMSVLFSICIISFVYLGRIFSLNLGFFTEFLISLVNLVCIFTLIGILFFGKNMANFFKKFNITLKFANMIDNYTKTVAKLNRKEWVIQFIISTLVWTLFPIKMLILVRSFGIQTHFLVILAITMTSYMVGMLPLSPGGIGTFEGVMITLFAMIFVENEISITITVIFRIITFWLVILISTIYVGAYKNVKKNS